MNQQIMIPHMIIIVGGIMIVSALFGALVASIKNRNADRWGFACFVFPPAFFILLLLPKGTYQRRRKISQDDLDEDIKDDWF